MAAHSYYRIRYRFPDVDNVQYAEVYFLDGSGVDLCTGGTVIYSSQYDGNTPYFAAANAFDRNNSTGYAAFGSTSQWIGYHFASPVDVAKVGVRGSGAFPANNAKGYLFEYSDDGVTWYTQQVLFDSAGNLTAGGYREFTVTDELYYSGFDTGAHRYWRYRPALTHLSGQYCYLDRIQFLDASNVDLVTGGETFSDSEHFSIYDAASGFAGNGYVNNGSWEWWVKVDFTTPKSVKKVRLESWGGNQDKMPRAFIIEYSDDNITWRARAIIFDETAWGGNEVRTYTLYDPIIVGISQTFTFDYSIAAQPFTKTFEFDYAITGSTVTQQFEFDYEIKGPIVYTAEFDYKIQLSKTFAFGYKILQDDGDVLGYRHIVPSVSEEGKRTFNYHGGPSLVGDTIDLDTIGPVTSPSITPLPSVVTVHHYNFYADYYERIWVTPVEIRLSNPKIGFEYPFNVWNAYDRSNEMITYIPTDVDGTTFVEGVDLPIEFGPIEFRVMHFTIDADAPSQIDGNMFFEFTMGGGGFDLFALVLGVLKTLPNEPFNETWTWFSLLEISRNGTEQRQAIRDEPRIQAGYQVAIFDEGDRRLAYEQFYNFATRSVLVPFFQYNTVLTQDAHVGDTRLYFDLSIVDVRPDEYIVLFESTEYQFQTLQVASLNSDGVNLVTPMTFDASADIWEVVPGRSMRLPNKSQLGMEAVTGILTFKGESTTWRNLLRPSGSVTLPSYDGIPVLPFEPIADNPVNETFDSDVEVIDNDSAPPVLRSTYTNPFIESTKRYLVDRTVEMDWWRTFFDYTKGMLRPFLVPTWREDLPLAEIPEIGDNELLTSNIAYGDFWPYETYKYIQIQSDSGVIYRRVESINFEETGLRLSLDNAIGLTPGSNSNLVISFLNLTRLNSDEVELMHFVNHTIIQVDTRTVNQ